VVAPAASLAAASAQRRPEFRVGMNFGNRQFPKFIPTPISELAEPGQRL
jgi:hypothetical protein